MMFDHIFQKNKDRVLARYWDEPTMFFDRHFYQGIGIGFRFKHRSDIDCPIIQFFGLNFLVDLTICKHLMLKPILQKALIFLL